MMSIPPKALRVASTMTVGLVGRVRSAAIA
jgi:hypothetical protein